MSLPTPYFQDDAVTLYHGDCREILPQLEAGSVDLVLTDPPYEAEAHTLQRRTCALVEQRIIDASLPFGPITQSCREQVSHTLTTLARRWVLTFCQIEAAPIWRKSYEDAGLVYKRTCIWVKPDGMPQYSGDRPGMGYETFLAMHVVGASRWNGGGRHGVFIENKGENGGRPNTHPTQKPLFLIRDLVNLFSDPGDLILDPFAGSGTTGRAAKDLGRRCIMIELEERYCEIAARRMAQAVLPLAGEE